MLRISIPAHQHALSAALDHPRVFAAYTPDVCDAPCSPQLALRPPPLPSPTPPPASQLRPRLYLGDVSAASPAFLSAHGVTHVLNALGEAHACPGAHVTLSLGLLDCETQPLDFAAPLHFIRSALHSSPHSVVLIHCFAGVSRSAALAMAWLMASERLRMEEALRVVRSARPRAAPNAAFLAQLVALEGALWGGGT